MGMADYLKELAGRAPLFFAGTGSEPVGLAARAAKRAAIQASTSSAIKRTAQFVAAPSLIGCGNAPARARRIMCSGWKPITSAASRLDNNRVISASLHLVQRRAFYLSES